MQTKEKAMKSQFILTVAALVIVSPAAAQVLSYHHRSTAFGDYAAGQAELELARGRAVVDRAYAYELRVRTERQRQSLLYDRMELRQLAKQLREERSQAAFEARKKREVGRRARNSDAAGRMLADVRQGSFKWPKLLATGMYSAERLRIEAVLRNWNGSESSQVQAAIVELAKQLRAKVLDPQANATHLERVQAMRVVTQLEYLSTTAGEERKVAKR
jgi:hypothetical protein